MGLILCTWSYGCATFVRMWHVEKGNRIVFSGRECDCVLHCNKRLSNATHQGCYTPDHRYSSWQIGTAFKDSLPVLEVWGGRGCASWSYKQCYCNRCESKWRSVFRLSTVLRVYDTHHHRIQACWRTVAPFHSPPPIFPLTLLPPLGNPLHHPMTCAHFSYIRSNEIIHIVNSQHGFKRWPS